MTIYQQLLGEFSLTSAMNDFTVDDGGGADAVALTVGDYYISGYNTESTPQLMEHMQAVIRALGSPYTSATVTRSSSTGLVSIDFQTGGTVAIAWTDGLLQTLLGFTGTQSGADSYTAGNKARYCWAPSLPPSLYSGDLTAVWSPDSTSLLSVAPDGTLVTTEGNNIYSCLIHYDLLDRDEVVSDSSTVWETFEAFWVDVVHKGMPIRFYPDKTLNTASSFVTGRLAPPDAALIGDDVVRIGALQGFVQRVQPGYQGLWRVAFALAKDI